MISAWTNSPVSASPPVSLAPQTLSQAILPGWLFANTVNVTEENSSSPETERQIVAAHSYGQQLGRILDAVNELIAERPAGAPDVQSIRDFESLWLDIKKIKLQPAIRRIEQAITDLVEVKQQDPIEYQRLAAGLQSILEDQSGADSGKAPSRLLGQAPRRAEGRTPTSRSATRTLAATLPRPTRPFSTPELFQPGTTDKRDRLSRRSSGGSPRRLMLPQRVGV